MLPRLLLIATLLLLPLSVNAEKSLGEAIKKIFSTPTPTPKPKKKKSTSPVTKTSPTPSPTSSPKKKPSPAPTEESPSPSASPKKKKATAKEEESETPTPKKKKTISPTPSESASPHKKKKASPTPQPFETPESSPSETPSPTPTPTPTPTPSLKEKHGAPNATLSPNELKGFENYPAKVQQVVRSALELTTRDLDYKYGSADPSNGGMDCSGFVYFVLKQNGFTDVPRDSSELYNWLRRDHAFEPVLSEKDDSFELENLKPGDLLFWTGTYSIERDPPITHAMIYLGREKKNGHRVMVGSSDGRVYQGESRNGVSVFDFKIQRGHKNDEGKLHPTFVGYGHLPGLRE